MCTTFVKQSYFGKQLSLTVLLIWTFGQLGGLVKRHAVY